MHTYAILFVCMGNICRSPTADGVFRAKLKQLGLQNAVHVDSAGTHNYHPDSPPDARSQTHAARRGMTCQTYAPARFVTRILSSSI